MSVSFQALFFYGMRIKGEVGYEVIDTFNECNRNLEIMHLSPMTNMEDGYMLFVPDSYHSADRNEDERLVKLGDVTGREGEWQGWIRDACERLGFEYAEPDWYFATQFS